MSISQVAKPCVSVVSNPSKSMNYFIQAIKDCPIREGFKFPLKINGKTVEYECVHAHPDSSYQFKKTVKNGTHETVGHFTYYPQENKIIRDSVNIESHRGLAKYKYADDKTYLKFDDTSLRYMAKGKMYSPEIAYAMEDNMTKRTELIMPDDFKSAVDFIKNKSALKGYFSQYNKCLFTEISEKDRERLRKIVER